MSNINNKNRYECYKVDYREDMALGYSESEETLKLTTSQSETVTIYVSKMSCGLWVYGYVVYWANGRTSYSACNAELGLFKSKREAQLYAIGFMQLYGEYFTSETREALQRAEEELRQGSLFE